MTLEDSIGEFYGHGQNHSYSDIITHTAVLVVLLNVSFHFYVQSENVQLCSNSIWRANSRNTFSFSERQMEYKLNNRLH